MSEDLYEVRVDGIPYATNISLEAAIVMVESLFKKWFAEPNLAFEIRRITKATNADRIRSMTDEELAEFINMVWGNGRASRHPSNGWEEWLKEEAGET